MLIDRLEMLTTKPQEHSPLSGTDLHPPPTPPLPPPAPKLNTLPKQIIGITLVSQEILVVIFV